MSPSSRSSPGALCNGTRPLPSFKEEHGREPTKREVAKLVKASRAKKMPQSNAEEVLARQRQRLTTWRSGGKSKRSSRQRHCLEHPKEFISEAEALTFSLGDLLERNSTVRETELLRNALEHARGDLDLAVLKAELERGLSAQTLFRFGDWITTREMLLAEERLCRWVKAGKGPLLPPGLGYSAAGPVHAGTAGGGEGNLGSQDRVMALIGDAGTSKTTCAKYIAEGIQASGQGVLGLAPTGSAVVELRQVVSDCDTLQGFLVNPRKQQDAANKVLLVDEAGMIDVRSMARLAELSQEWNYRVVLIGDPKQNRSVAAGDAFRCLLEDGALETHHLTEIWRQTDPAFKNAVQLLAQGNRGGGF